MLPSLSLGQTTSVMILSGLSSFSPLAASVIGKTLPNNEQNAPTS